MFEQLDDFCQWLENTPVARTIQDVAWVIPTLQTIHIVAVALVFSSVILLNLRLTGLIGGEQSQAAVARRFVPFILWPLPALLITGALLISAEPARSLQNPSFVVKMAALFGGIALTLLYAWKLRTAPAYWETTASRRVAVRLISATSLALWVGVVIAGRWIAYTQP